MAQPQSEFDVAIVGGGPAGLTAALWLGRYLHRVVVIDSGDPRNWETRGVNGFPGHPGITPAELRGKTRDECRQYGVELVDGFVVTCPRRPTIAFELQFDPMRSDEGPTMITAGPVLRATPVGQRTCAPRRARFARARLLLAFGLRDEWPKVPGLRAGLRQRRARLPRLRRLRHARQESRCARVRPESSRRWRSTSRRGRATS